MARAAAHDRPMTDALLTTIEGSLQVAIGSNDWSIMLLTTKACAALAIAHPQHMQEILALIAFYTQRLQANVSAPNCNAAVNKPELQQAAWECERSTGKSVTPEAQSAAAPVVPTDTTRAQTAADDRRSSKRSRTECTQYMCKYPGCEKQYASTDAVRKHCRLTHGEWLVQQGVGPSKYTTPSPSASPPSPPPQATPTLAPPPLVPPLPAPAAVPATSAPKAVAAAARATLQRAPMVMSDPWIVQAFSFCCGDL